jgi:hypothetical protein
MTSSMNISLLSLARSTLLPATTIGSSSNTIENYLKGNVYIKQILGQVCFAVCLNTVFFIRETILG